MPRVLVPLAQGCEDLEAVTIIDVLRRGGLEVITAGLDHNPVKGARGTVFLPDAPLDAVKGQNFDLVALPGGQPGTDNLRKDARIKDLVQRHQALGAWLGAVCAAPLVLAEAGALRGRNATSYPGALAGDPHGAVLVDAPVVTDGKVVTGRSAGTSLDFSLALVEALLGREKRAEVEEKLVRR